MLSRAISCFEGCLYKKYGEMLFKLANIYYDENVSYLNIITFSCKELGVLGKNVHTRVLIHGRYIHLSKLILLASINSTLLSVSCVNNSLNNRLKFCQSVPIMSMSKMVDTSHLECSCAADTW